MYPPAPWPEPGPSTAVTWRARVGARDYTYVALHIAGSGWFLTGQMTEPLGWAALCHHLPPVDGRFLVLGVIGQINPTFTQGAA